MYLRLASILLCAGLAEAARRHYRTFVSLLHDDQLPDLCIYGQFMAAIASVPLANGITAFREGLWEVLPHIAQANSVRVLMMVPIIGCEFHCSFGLSRDAAAFCGRAIDRITRLWTGNLAMKSIVVALLYERLAGVLVNPRRSLLATARAG
jgi:hypothetical protein